MPSSAKILSQRQTVNKQKKSTRFDESAINGAPDKQMRLSPPAGGSNNAMMITAENSSSKVGNGHPFDQTSIDTQVVNMKPNLRTAHTGERHVRISQQSPDATMPFKLDSPQRLDRVIHEQMIEERPDDESLLLKQSGISLNTTNLIASNPLMRSELESVLSLQPEKLELRNLQQK